MFTWEEAGQLLPLGPVCSEGHFFFIVVVQICTKGKALGSPKREQIAEKAKPLQFPGEGRAGPEAEEKDSREIGNAGKRASQEPKQ